jgi:hypothetical protein
LLPGDRIFTVAEGWIEVTWEPDIETGGLVILCEDCTLDKDIVEEKGGD